MSSLSAQLLGVRRLRHSPWMARWAEITRRLILTHGTPTLGNFRDPVKEIFYILLSAKTADAQYRATHKALVRAYPTLPLNQPASSGMPMLRRYLKVPS